MTKMDDERAKEIIRRYQTGQASLANYVEAIEYCAVEHPDLTMAELSGWANSDAKFSDELDGVCF